MQYDVITIGGGLSGLVTACRASQGGLKVAVLEQRSEDCYPCSSRFSSGVFAAGRADAIAPPEEIYASIMEITAGKARPELARAMANTAKSAYEWVQSQGGRFVSYTGEGASRHILAPPRRFREGLDWKGRGADLLMRTLERQILARGGQVLRGAHVESLIVEGDACVGVRMTRDGGPMRIDANKAVVVADGGFPANPELVGRFITPRADRVLARCGPGAKGEGILMAETAGAAIGGFGAFYGHIHHKDAMTNENLWPYPHFDALAQVSLLVGQDGKRFADEGLGGVALANAIAHLEDPLSAWIVIDDAMWEGAPGRAGPVGCNPFLMSGGASMTSASGIEALASKMGIPGPALVDTVRRYNEAVAVQNFGDLDVPRTTKRWKPLPLAKPPFRAAPLCAGITGTMGGIEINMHAQALRPDGSVFPGLYAVGTPIARLEGGPLAGYVGGLGKAFVFGLIAGAHIADAQ